MNAHNNPPRVPKGWTEAMASFVWNDWLDCLSGKWKSLVSGQLVEFLVDIPGLKIAPCKRPCVEGDSYFVTWSTPEARLHAWAAVGAPVIPPSEG